MAEAHQLDLDPASLQIVQGILGRHVPDRPVFVFGSRARGKSGRRSDLDLAIGGADPLRRAILADLKEDFTESDLPILVDILEICSLDSGFLSRIQQDFIPVPPVSNQRD